MTKRETKTFNDDAYPFLNKPVSITKQRWPDDVPPLVSIRCKTYMHEKFIQEAIEGFLMQKTSFRVEVLIHDDASLDNTANIVRKYEKNHPQLIKATYQVENQYKKKPKTDKYIEPHSIKGKYVAVCEGDDCWTDPLKLETQICFLENNPNHTMSCGGFVETNTNDPQQNRTVLKTSIKGGKNGFSFSLREMEKTWLVQTLTVVYRRSAVKDLDRSIYKYRRDVHLFYHLIKKGKGFYHAKVFGKYNLHPGGVYSPTSHAERLHYHFKLYQELYEINKDDFCRRMYLKLILLVLLGNLKGFARKQKQYSSRNLLDLFFRVAKTKDFFFVLKGFLNTAGVKKVKL